MSPKRPIFLHKLSWTIEVVAGRTELTVEIIDICYEAVIVA
jgi:hypothetical protein